MANPSTYYPTEIPDYPESGDLISASVLQTIFEVIASHAYDSEQDITELTSALTANITAYEDHVDGNDDVHSISHITGLQTSLDAKATASVLTALEAEYDAHVAGTADSHAIADITGLQTALDAKTTESYVDSTIATELSGYSTTSHTHATYMEESDVTAITDPIEADITALEATVDSKVAREDINDLDVGYLFTYEFTASASTEVITSDDMLTECGLSTSLHIDPSIIVEIWSVSGVDRTYVSKTGYKVTTTVPSGTTTSVLYEVTCGSLSSGTTYGLAVSFKLITAT